MKNNVLQGSGRYTYEDGSFMGMTAFDEQEVFLNLFDFVQRHGRQINFQNSFKFNYKGPIEVLFHCLNSKAYLGHHQTYM